ncbi:hypothetical protein ANCDUO_16125 [Ancylostoma duodenale]|uniref:Uncharacterized protein n=1 Tax=Ancylostoma duodenale TaxID=51022 RepID=A0A0C2G472_9BILA|nr:hypothetical protein ANCDUO_16125 [Ancylostoma duodenale]
MHRLRRGSRSKYPLSICGKDVSIIMGRLAYVRLPHCVSDGKSKPNPRHNSRPLHFYYSWHC